MKKLLISLLTFVFFANAFAQTPKTDRRKGSSLGVSFFLNDFKTAAELRKYGLSYVVRNKNLFNTSRMNAGVAISYVKGLGNHVDFIGSLGGSSLDYPISGKPAFGKNYFLLEATGGVNVKLLSDKYWVIPYATAGLGASSYKDFFAAFIPVGAGVQVKIFKTTFLLINSQYRIPVTENASYHLYHSFGFITGISKKKAEPKKVVPPVVEVHDRD